MTKMSASRLRAEFAEALNQVAYGKERIVIHRRSKQLAALVPIADLEFIEMLEDRLDAVEAVKALREAKARGWIPWDDAKRELDI